MRLGKAPRGVHHQLHTRMRPSSFPQIPPKWIEVLSFAHYRRPNTREVHSITYLSTARAPGIVQKHRVQIHHYFCPFHQGPLVAGTSCSGQISPHETPHPGNWRPIRWDIITWNRGAHQEGEGAGFSRFAHQIADTAGFRTHGAADFEGALIRHSGEPHSCRWLQQVHQGYESACHAKIWPARHGLPAPCHRAPSSSPPLPN